MPVYKRGGVMVTAFANQKGCIAFYAGQAAIRAHKKELAGIDGGRGCIRHKNIAKIDCDAVRSLLENIAAWR